MFEVIKKIFGGKNLLEENVKENLDITITPIAFNVQFGKNTDEQVSELLKKATSLKKTDIEQAILLIKLALNIDPKYPCYDKLKNYLMMANKEDEAEELTIKLIDECKGNTNLFNFSSRSSNYESYSGILFKKESYNKYIFYYCLSIYNRLVWDAISEQIESVKAQLNILKNKEELIDKKTNKSFQEIGASSNQDLFIKTFYEILKSCEFEALYKLVFYLNNKQKGREEFEIEAIKNGKEDWKLWSNQQFQNMISLYDEQIFIEKYKSKLEILL